MDFDRPAGESPIDAERLVGKPLNRVEGKLKVQGRAPYAYETHEGAAPAYGFLLTAGAARGRITAMDFAAAESAPGVLLVMTHENRPAQAEPGADTVPQLYSAEIKHHGQAIALVVAEHFEQARAAALMIGVTYETAGGVHDLAANVASAEKPPEGMFIPDVSAGDFDAAFEASPVRIDATYTTPPQSQAMMEPHATLALWEGDCVTLYTAAQMLNPTRDTIARTLQLPPGRVRVVSRYVGGGFGSKLKVFGDAILAALAARALGRPVKIALTRQQIFNHTSARSATIQRIRLGAGTDGRLSAIGHDSIVSNLPGKTFFEPAGVQTTMLYAGANRTVTHRMVALDITESASMRAPGEAVGMLALECAMDELAIALDIDPIELRIRNEPAVNPQDGTPYSARKLVDCMREGARLFGWERRDKVPGRRREGGLLIGTGMAAAVRGNMLRPSAARATLTPDGRLVVSSSMTDIGTGTYTILTQIAGEMMGLGPDEIDMELGDTEFPAGAGSGGSWGASSAGSAVYDACAALRARIAAMAELDERSAVFADGFIRQGNIARRLTEFVGPEGLTATGEVKPGRLADAYTQAGYGAHFAEVSVDIDTGEIRVRRMLGVFAAGRILNAKTARSQAIGGMVFGIGAALMEDAVVDPAFGYFVNHDLAEYHIPVHADVPDIEAVYLEERDDKANPLKSKGVGELGISGAGAAIANAVYNACGVRIRDYPLTLDKVIAGLDSLA
jgi:xanthine dehydrogenase YagR molybdenum-binding subunit